MVGIGKLTMSLKAEEEFTMPHGSKNIQEHTILEESGPVSASIIWARAISL